VKAVKRPPRFSLPFGPSALKATIELHGVTDVDPLAAHLWDVSDAGCCLAIKGSSSLMASGAALLNIFNPSSRQWRKLPVELRWISSLSHGTFVGARFTGGPLPQDIFLRDYMQRSWTDAVPGGASYS
jgi:hypothetical protein